MQLKDVRPQSFVYQLRCDRCDAEAQHNVGDGFNNFLSIGFDASWGSALGDGKRIEIDLCHGCLQQVLGPWLRISESIWARTHDEMASVSDVEHLDRFQEDQ